MGLFEKIFKKEKKEKEVKKEEEKVIGNCIVCNKPIYKNEEYKTISFQNQKYYVHLKCFRKAKKMAKKYISGNIKF